MQTQKTAMRSAITALTKTPRGDLSFSLNQTRSEQITSLLQTTQMESQSRQPITNSQMAPNNLQFSRTRLFLAKPKLKTVPTKTTKNVVGAKKNGALCFLWRTKILSHSIRLKMLIYLSTMWCPTGSGRLKPSFKMWHLASLPQAWLLAAKSKPFSSEILRPPTIFRHKDWVTSLSMTSQMMP